MKKYWNFVNINKIYFYFFLIILCYYYIILLDHILEKRRKYITKLQHTNDNNKKIIYRAKINHYDKLYNQYAGGLFDSTESVDEDLAEKNKKLKINVILGMISKRIKVIHDEIKEIKKKIMLNYYH